MVPLLLALTLQTQRPVTVAFCGDIMLNGLSVASKPLAPLTPLLTKASAAIANLEIPLTSARVPTTFKSAAELEKRNQFVLKADPAHAKGIRAAGIDLVSLGNNHCMDYRAEGMRQMQRALAKAGIVYAGAGSNEAQADSPAIYRTKSGLRIGLVSALAFLSGKALKHCTPATVASAGVATLAFNGTIDETARARLASLVSLAKERCDLVVVGLHWGIERQTVPSAWQVTLGRACVDAGADVVWGNHPHVLQGGELYRGKPILYSMGNLISSKEGPTGVVKLTYDAEGLAGVTFDPLSIAGGRVKPAPPANLAARRREYEKLCRQVLKRFPNRYSQPLFPLSSK